VRGLEKLTKDLRTAIAAWEDAQGKPFCYGGERYLDTINAQEELYASSRDSARSARKRKDSSGVPANPPAKVMRKTTGATAPASKVMPLSAKNLDQHVNDENTRNASRSSSGSGRGADKAGRVSTMSSDTMCSSATEVRERASTCTVSHDDYRTF
jgi:hypothetical protein